LGLLALGETPRDDVVPTLQGILGETVQIHQLGGLDGLTTATAVESLVAREGETPVETRLRSGTSVTLAKERLIPRLIEAAAQLATYCDTVLLLCSGEFPAVAAACPKLIEPIRILRGIVASAARKRVLGLVGPASDLERAPAQWHPYAADLICAAASPYDSLAAAEKAGRELASRGANLIFLDDMGFSEDHRRAVSRATRLPVMCATTLVARVVSEIV
jgi:protein AroM